MECSAAPSSGVVKTRGRRQRVGAPAAQRVLLLEVAKSAERGPVTPRGVVASGRGGEGRAAEDKYVGKLVSSEGRRRPPALPSVNRRRAHRYTDPQMASGSAGRRASAMGAEC